MPETAKLRKGIPTDCLINFTGDCIKVLGGEDEPTTFIVHSKIICKSSDYFKAAMNHEWTESKQRSVTLEEEEPEIFAIYVHWLYRGTLPERPDGMEREESDKEWCQLAEAYVLGDRLQDGDLADTVIDAIIEKPKTPDSERRASLPPKKVVQYIYENTTTSSKARRMLVDIYAYNGPGKWFFLPAKEEELPSDFLYSLNATILGLDGTEDRPKTTGNPTYKPSTCEYHQHGPDPKLCYKARLLKPVTKRMRQL